MSVESKRLAATEEPTCPFCRKRNEEASARDSLERSTDLLTPSGEYNRTSACDVCRNGNGKTEAAISELHCADCHQNLCAQCSRIHGNFNATRHHCTTPIRQQGNNTMTELPPTPTPPPPPTNMYSLLQLLAISISVSF